MRILFLLIVAQGIGELALIGKKDGASPLKLAFIAAMTTLMLLIVWRLVRLMLAPWAIATIQSAIWQLRAGKQPDRGTVERACWALKRTAEIREFRSHFERNVFSDELLSRIEAALPRLAGPAGRKRAILRVVMFVCVIAGAVARVMQPPSHTQAQSTPVHQMDVGQAAAGR